MIGSLLLRNFLLKQVIEEKAEERIEVTGRRERRRKQLPDDHKKNRAYWKYKDVLDRAVRRTRFGRVYGPVARETSKFYEITNRCSYMQSILFHC